MLYVPGGFQTHPGRDVLTVNNMPYSGGYGPYGVHVLPGNRISWGSGDGGSGVTLCGAVSHTVSITSLTPALVAPTTCPLGWTPAFGRCFKGVCDMQNWTSAQADCVNHGANLATVDTPDVGSFLRSLVVGTGPVWIGYRENSVNDDGSEQQWFVFNPCFVFLQLSQLGFAVVFHLSVLATRA
jgi:hypothetical protein